MYYSNEIAVVTAVTGSYDHVGTHKHYRHDVDYLFFTDGTSEPKDGIWQLRDIPEFTDDPWKRAKLPKINPHAIEELRDYKYVIWIDGSMQIINAGFIDSILSYIDHGLVLSPHFDGRDCGYGEATIRPPKYQNERLDDQCNFYRSEGFPEHYGLWEAGVEARKMHSPGLEDFEEMWMKQIMDWTIQDQVSLGYSLWKTGFTPDVLDKSWRDYGWLHINAHRREDPREDG